MALTQVDQGLLGQYAQYTGFKNRIINGAMVIAQRGTSLTNPNGYTLDRWYVGNGASTTVIQQSSNVPSGSGFNYSLYVNQGASTWSPGTSNWQAVVQEIEGYNVADLGFGTANAKTVTLSFWVYASLTGTYALALTNSPGANINGSVATRSYVSTYTVNASNTWQYVTVTIPGDVAGTWVGATNGGAMAVVFNLGSGSNYTTATTNAWQAGGYWQTSGSVSLSANANATFYITGVQLEKGSTATSFDYRPYGTELQLCQRYYYRLKAATSYTNAGSGRAYSITNGQAFVAMPVSMRAAPVSTGYSALTDWNAAQASGNITAMSPAAQYSADFRQMTIDVTATFTSGSTVALNANNTTNAWIEWSAEL